LATTADIAENRQVNKLISAVAVKMAAVPDLACKGRHRRVWRGQWGHARQSQDSPPPLKPKTMFPCFEGKNI
jgi:hypothetical protein